MRQSRIKERIERIKNQIDDLNEKYDNHDCDFPRNCTIHAKLDEEIENKRAAQWELESMLPDYSHANPTHYGL